MRKREVSRSLAQLAAGEASDAVRQQWARVEQRRTELHHSDGAVEDLHGQVTGAGDRVAVGDESARASSPAWKCQLLFNLADSFKATTVVELGSAFGISGAYLAAAVGRHGGRVVTVEGVEGRAEHARETYRSLGLDNISSVVGLFDDHLDLLDGADFLFVDGNHFADPTKTYVSAATSKMSRPGLLVLDDVVGYSDEMEEAWRVLAGRAEFALHGTVEDVGVLGIGRFPWRRPLAR